MRVSFCNLGKVNEEVRPQLNEAYARVMARGQYILGPEVEDFELEWATYCQRTHCVGTGNAYDALRLMLRAYGIGRGDEVIVPANTYIATWLAVSAVGALPVPVDPDESMNIGDIGHAVTPRTKAVLAVHLYGRAANVTYLRGWTRELGIPLLIDAAQAHGLKGDFLGDCAAFSFYPTKNLGALGDGGAVVTNNGEIAAAVSCLRNYGSPAKNRNSAIGINSRLDELQAAFLRAKLPKLDEFNRRRADHAAAYGQTIPYGMWHQCVIRSESRSEFIRDMAERGIETAIHYPTPPHLQPAYAGLDYGVGSFPVAERMAREVVSVPVGPELTAEQVAHVADALMVPA